MGEVRTKISLHDGVTSTADRINAALGRTTGVFRAVSSAAGANVNTSGLTSIASKSASACTEAAELKGNLDRVANAASGGGVVQNLSNIENQTQKVERATDSLKNKVKSLLGAYAGLQGIKMLVNLSDTMSSNEARLNLIVDDNNTVDTLKDKIFASAQSARASYADTMAQVSKLGLVAGKAFNNNNDEIIKFTELVNKNFVVGGASAQEQSSAMYQLTQAMGSGRLQGDEYRSIIENAPLLAKSIEEYMVNVKGATGTMKDWASEGKLTADVIKAAVFNSADEVEERFNTIPLTWAQVWTMCKNTIIRLLDPVLKFISFLAQNWEVIAPLVLGVAAALSVYLVATNAATIASKVLAAAQAALNAVLAINPVFIVIIALIALIAAVYAVVAAINKAKGTTTSATGVIVGAISAACAFLWNIVVGLIDEIMQFIWAFFVEPFIGIIEFVLNAANGGFTSFGGAVANLIGNIISWFLSLGKVVTKIIDAIFGTNWSAGLSALQNTVLAWGKNETAITISREAWTAQSVFGDKFNRVDYSGAYNKGYTAGTSFENKITGKIGEWFPGYDGIAGDVGDIADSTAKSAKNGDITAEELSYLRDIASKEAVNRFTTAKLSVNLGGITNQVTSNTDLDGIVSYLTNEVSAALLTAANGVHV